MSLAEVLLFAVLKILLIQATETHISRSAPLARCGKPPKDQLLNGYSGQGNCAAVSQRRTLRKHQGFIARRKPCR